MHGFHDKNHHMKWFIGFNHATVVTVKRCCSSLRVHHLILVSVLLMTSFGACQTVSSIEQNEDSDAIRLNIPEKCDDWSDCNPRCCGCDVEFNCINGFCVKTGESVCIDGVCCPTPLGCDAECHVPTVHDYDGTCDGITCINSPFIDHGCCTGRRERDFFLAPETCGLDGSILNDRLRDTCIQVDLPGHPSEECAELENIDAPYFSHASQCCTSGGVCGIQFGGFGCLPPELIERATGQSVQTIQCNYEP